MEASGRRDGKAKRRLGHRRHALQAYLGEQGEADIAALLARAERRVDEQGGETRPRWLGLPGRWSLWPSKHALGAAGGVPARHGLT